ncbi:hypothetical protein [Streptomyces sp. NRRL B-24572]|uniref:hypothetical protein n=1 Tax=Streptomyces sp. NRRL B-24572 TaxID=1962156 RepID=UPI00117BFE35|nr:hypothetical protein [Streptomyces sp. NRRL B-24572]
MTGFSGRGPYEALRRGRTAVDRLAASLAANGGTLREVTATQVLLAEASPRVLFQEFTAAEEVEAGADWMWWWVNRDGTCFGLLTQAKILKVSSSRRWTVDFGYTTAGHSRSQMTKLIEAAEPYRVPAAYVLYCGDRKYRATLECSRTHGGVLCRDRERVGVSVVCALVAQEAARLHQHAAGVEVFHDAIPVEDIASPAGLDEPVHSLVRELDDELARFLRQPQRGARRVAKELLRPLGRIRLGQFADAGTLERKAPVADAVFRDVPADRGHFSVPYLDHVLRGLRTGVPDYVRDVMEGRPPPAWVTGRLGGIVVIPEADALG